MKNNAAYFKTGLMVLAGIATLAAGLLWIAGDRLGGDTVLVETYIDESVQGLSVGSPVVYRGVNIGYIREITFVPQQYNMPPDSDDFQRFSRYVMVIMALDAEAFPGQYEDASAFQSMIYSQVNAGLRFKLSYQGITGIAFLEADYIKPERETPLNVPWVPKRLYVPSTPSLMRSFTEAIENLFRRLEKLDVEGILANMQTTLATMDQAITDANVIEIRHSFVTLTEEIRQSNQKLQPLLDNARHLPDDLKAAVGQFQSTMARIETLLNQNEPNLEKIIADLRQLMQNFRHLSENLKQDPAQLLLSAPPKQSEVVQ